MYVGTSVGKAVGALDGIELGLGVGALNLYDGASVGCSDGSLVGSYVGTGVGTPLMYVG